MSGQLNQVILLEIGLSKFSGIEYRINTAKFVSLNSAMHLTGSADMNSREKDLVS